MSTSKTQNYQLHSWIPQDEFHLTEINENFTKLDTSLKAEVQERTQKVTSLESSLKDLDGRKIQMVTGSYTGQGTTPTTVELGFKAKVVIAMNTTDGGHHFMAVENGPRNRAITLTETGFTAINVSDEIYSNINRDPYHFIAIY